MLAGFDTKKVCFHLLGRGISNVGGEHVTTNFLHFCFRRWQIENNPRKRNEPKNLWSPTNPQTSLRNALIEIMLTRTGIMEWRTRAWSMNQVQRAAVHWNQVARCIALWEWWGGKEGRRGEEVCGARSSGWLWHYSATLHVFCTESERNAFRETKNEVRGTCSEGPDLVFVGRPGFWTHGEDRFQDFSLRSPVKTCEDLYWAGNLGKTQRYFCSK